MLDDVLKIRRETHIIAIIAKDYGNWLADWRVKEKFRNRVKREERNASGIERIRRKEAHIGVHGGQSQFTTGAFFFSLSANYKI